MDSIILYPTDTVYGLGVDATDPEAVSRLQALKGRDDKKPISIVVADAEMLKTYAVVTPLAKRLIEKFLPGKLTIVLDAVPGMFPERITGTNRTVGVRIPNHPVPLKIVRDMGKPITATSANVAGMSTFDTPKEILAQFGEKAAWITEVVDEGELPASLPSTVLDARGETPVIIREGAVSAKELSEL